MLNNIKWFIRCFIERVKQRKNGTHISRKVKINGKIFFEGCNFVGEATELTESSLGKMTYIASNCKFENTKIGKFTSIGPNCKVIYGDHPTKEFVSTHPAFYSNFRPAGKCYVKRNKFDEIKYADKEENRMLCIGNDVWLASDVCILAGCTISDGAVVAAGALVTTDIPPYAVVGGVPARVIRYRFSQKQIDWLLQLKWWDKDESWIISHAECFENITKLINEVDREENKL